VGGSVCSTGFTALRECPGGPGCWRSKQGDGTRLLTVLLANMWEAVMQPCFPGGLVVCGWATEGEAGRAADAEGENKDGAGAADCCWQLL